MKLRRDKGKARSYNTKKDEKTKSVYNIWMMKILMHVLAILLGIFLFIFGGYDDSPGAQGLGVLTVILGVVGIVKRKRNSSF